MTVSTSGSGHLAPPVVTSKRGSARRWFILSLLTCFSTVCYIERINLSVAARFIRDEFGLTDTQIGWSFSCFLLSYTVAQLPAGALVDRFGPRRVLAVAGCAWFVVTVLLAVVAGHIVATAGQMFATLIVSRLALGLVEAPTYPGAALTIARWFPADARGVPNAIIQATSFAGEALTLVALAALTTALGWRSALFLSALPALAVAAAWWYWGADRPEEDTRVSPSELALIQRPDGALAKPLPKGPGSRWEILKDSRLSFLSAAYFCHGYVTYLFFFWFYIYLVDERHFTAAAGGWVGALPTIAAALCAFGGGHLSDKLAMRYGPIIGRRWLIAGAGIIGGAALLIGAFALTPSIAIVGFMVAVGSRGLVESAFWSIVNDIGGENSGVVAGLMNGLGNLGGVVSTILAPTIVASFGWPTAMSVAAGVVSLTGLLMFGIKAGPDRLIRD
jgi:ACS family glucarate transporter-like MFS transporter